MKDIELKIDTESIETYDDERWEVMSKRTDIQLRQIHKILEEAERIRKHLDDLKATCRPTLN